MRIGLLTSGGDAPGMNAAIRTLVWLGAARGHVVVGYRQGYRGLLAGDLVHLALDDVDAIGRFGGTVLGSSRSPEFATPEGIERAARQVRDARLDALVVIGGNGSLTGAHALSQTGACRVVGVPCSIDNDIGHCGLSIGVDTAVNTIVEACDRISDTARAHRRAFLVEVMGRDCGFLAMRAGIAANADAILYAEEAIDEADALERLREVLRRSFSAGRGRKRVLILKSEGVKVDTHRLAAGLQRHLDADAPGVGLRVTILGHLVRGGNPTALDRVIAQRTMYAAFGAAVGGADDVMAGWEVPLTVGHATPDPYVRLVPLPDMIEESQRLRDGTSEVVRSRIALLQQVEDILAL